MPTIQYSQSEGSFFEDARGVANEGKSTPGALIGREVKRSVCFYTELIIKASSADQSTSMSEMTSLILLHLDHPSETLIGPKADSPGPRATDVGYKPSSIKLSTERYEAM